jgi:ribosomal protein S18 acetylase RimI-like enzyme
MTIQIRRANSEDAPVLTEIAQAAKSFRGFPDDWADYWKEDLFVTPDFINRNEVYVAMCGDEVAGFSAISRKDDRVELEHLWVKPEHIDSGAGRELFMHAMERACQLNA